MTPMSDRAPASTAPLPAAEGTHRMHLDGEDGFRSLADQAPVLIWMSGVAGEVTYLSRGWERFTGRSPEAILARGWADVLHPDDHDRVMGTYRESFAGRKPFAIEHRLRHHDGSYRWVASHGSPRTIDGRFGGFVGVCHDISDARRAGEQLAQERFRFGQSVACAPIAIAFLDSEMRYLACSRKWLADFDLAGVDVTGRSHYEVFPDIPEHWKALHRRALAGESLSCDEDRFDRAGGQTTWLRWAIEPWRHPDGRVAGIIIVSDVITDLVHARQEALTSARLKAEFLASMSHEIRTPMNGVLGMTGLLLGTELTGEQRDFADTIRNSAESLLTVINDILDFSKIEAGKLEIEAVPFDLHRTAEEVADLLMPAATEKGIEVVVRYGPDVPRHLVGDAGRVRQLLVNLLSNAVKFTPHGHVLLHVTCESPDPFRPLLRFTVSDTGIGIPTDKLGLLFQKFIQAESSTTRRFGGTGLGLAICQQLVRLMGGQIGVTSTVGSGSAFWFTLALPVAPGTRPSTRVALPPGRRLLIVDDVELTRRVIAEQVEYLGAVADTAADGSEALERIAAAHARGQAYHTVLLDFSMPVLDGEGVARALRADRRFDGTRLILVSGAIGRPRDAWMRDLGISAFLRKPTRFDALAEVLCSALEPTPGPAPPVRPGPEAAARPGPPERRRVLVVDDNSVNQKVAARLLSRLGCRVDLAVGGREAVAMVTQQPYDLVFMDCMMPDMDGYEATQAIRGLAGPPARTPIVAMTANAMQGDRERCLAAGMDDYLSKPVQPELLRAMLERWTKLEPDPAAAAEPGARCGEPAA